MNNIGVLCKCIKDLCSYQFCVFIFICIYVSLSEGRLTYRNTLPQCTFNYMSATLPNVSIIIEEQYIMKVKSLNDAKELFLQNKKDIF